MLNLYYCEPAHLECDMIYHCDGEAFSKNVLVEGLRAEAAIPKAEKKDTRRDSRPFHKPSASSKLDGVQPRKKLDVDALSSRLRVVQESRETDETEDDLIASKNLPSLRIDSTKGQTVYLTPTHEVWRQCSATSCDSDALDFSFNGPSHTWKLL